MKSQFLGISVGLFLACFFAPGALALDCFDYSLDQQGATGPLIFESNPPDGMNIDFFHAHGRYGQLLGDYFMTGLQVLELYDLEASEPMVPVYSLSFFEGPTWAIHGFGDGPLASYIIEDNEGPRSQSNFVRDLSDPDLPHGTTERSGVTHIKGSAAYVRDDGAYWIYSLADVENPAFEGSFSLSGDVLDVVFDEGQACILYDDFSLEIWDVSTPSTPQLLSSLAVPNSPTNLSRGSNDLVLGCGELGVMVVNLADPANPTLPDSILDTPGEVNSTLVRQPFVYVACGDEGIRVVDISGDQPVLLPGSIAVSARKLSAGVDRIFHWGGAGVSEIPLHCGNETPVTKSKMGSFKSMYR